jgi:hypothetical protein
MVARGLSAPQLGRWHVTALLATGDQPPAPDIDDRRDSRFRIEIYSEEWGYFFCHGGQASWVRVTDIAFAHGRDDFELLAMTPALEDIGQLLGQIEVRHRMWFRREHALIITNVASAESAARNWVRSL